ncbi:hypothetical protein GF312_22075 [Candidatus Poribacteria bacterium]|nr:hypothetical protein [Candidatus Poribacteria bacterium]
MPEDMKSDIIDYGMYPFWFWNGELSKEEIEWQIKEMADKGIKGFFIHSRQGLKQPYLSESFFQMVQVAVETAEKYGLIVHLYDEYPYPSGIAGGEVTLGNPQYHSTRLVQQTFDFPGGHIRKALPRGKTLCCMAYPLKDGRVNWSQGVDLIDHVGVVLIKNSYNQTGLTQYNRKRYFASNPTPVLQTSMLEGPHRVYVSTQILVENHKYWGNFVDVLNPEAIKHFIELTHKRYKKRFGHRFGKSICSIFVDETAPSWSSLIPEAFKTEYGYDLVPLMPALQDSRHPNHRKVAYDLYKLRYKLFCQSFEEQISGWCKENGLKYSGEKTSLRLSQLKYMDIPGCEPGHTKAGANMDLLRPRIRQNARATASAAYFYGKDESLCECFHSLGWSGTIQDAKLISEGLMLMGIRYLVPHGFFYTTHALAKHDAPPTFFFQMPYWPLFSHLTNRLVKIAEQFENTYIDADILIVDPSSGMPSGDDLNDYEKLLNMLMEEHLDYLIVDTDILESGKINDGMVHIRDIKAEKVVIPNMRVIEKSLAEWLDKFQKSGGEVIKLKSSFNYDETASMLSQNLVKELKIKGSASKIQVVKRTDGDKSLWFFINTSGDEIELNIESSFELEEIPLGDCPINILTGSDGKYSRTVYPFESFMIETVEKSSLPVLPPKLPVLVSKVSKVVTKNKNLLRMYDWNMELLGKDGQVLQSAKVSAAPLPNQLIQADLRFAPKINTFFGWTPELQLPTLEIRYTYNFHNQLNGSVELVMEPGSIVGDWYIQVNNSQPITESDFSESQNHIRGSLGVDITEKLNQSNNNISVWLKTDQIDGGLLNPLYLYGDFGVELNPVKLVERNEKGGFETWEENGLPYYAGVVEYETEFELSSIPEGEKFILELKFGIPFQDAVEISLNNSSWYPASWSPYCALFSTSNLKKGKNSLKIRIYTTLIRSFEGQRFDIKEHRYQEIDE